MACQSVTLKDFILWRLLTIFMVRSDSSGHPYTHIHVSRFHYTLLKIFKGAKVSVALYRHVREQSSKHLREQSSS